MAEAGPVIPEGLIKLMECAICLSSVTNHRVLPCIHSFCQSCLEPLVHRDQVTCPVCRKVCPLDSQGVAGLPRNLMIMGIVDHYCEKCQIRAREVRCEHCHKHLCEVCHQVCSDEVTTVKDQLQAEITDLMSTGHQTLHQIHQDTVRVHHQVTAVSEQIDQTTQTIIGAILTRHRQLKQKLVKEGNTEIDRLNTQYQQLSDQIDKLKGFSDTSHTDVKQHLGDVHNMCEKWREETISTKKISQTTSQVNIEYTGDVQQIVDVNYGQIQVIKDRSATVATPARPKQNLVTQDRSATVTTLARPKQNLVTQDRSATVTTPAIPKQNLVTKDRSATVTTPATFKQNLVTQDSSATVTAPARPKQNLVTQDRSATVTQATQALTPIDYHSKGVPQQVIGSKGRQRGQFVKPSHVAVSPVSGNVVVCDRNNNRIQIYTDQGQFVSQFGSKGRFQGEFDVSDWSWCAGGVTVTAQGVIVVADTNNHRLQTFTEQGQFIRVIGQGGTQQGQFQSPFGLSCDNTGRIYVCDRDNKRIQVMEQDGTAVRVFGTQDVMGGWGPSGVDVCPNGDVVVADCTYNSKIEVFTASGQHKATLRHEKVKLPTDVKVDSQGNIIVTDCHTHQVHVLRQSGELICSWGKEGDRRGKLNKPVGVACTQDGRVVVVDQNNHRVQIF